MVPDYFRVDVDLMLKVGKTSRVALNLVNEAFKLQLTALYTAIKACSNGDATPLTALGLDADEAEAIVVLEVGCGFLHHALSPHRINLRKGVSAFGELRNMVTAVVGGHFEALGEADVGNLVDYWYENLYRDMTNDPVHSPLVAGAHVRFAVFAAGSNTPVFIADRSADVGSAYPVADWPAALEATAP